MQENIMIVVRDLKKKKKKKQPDVYEKMTSNVSLGKALCFHRHTIRTF